MTASATDRTAAPPAGRLASPLPPPLPERWHRPLLALSAVMAVLALVTSVLAIVDPREILGQNAWFKPLKFSISIAIYAVTLAWIIGQLRRFRRAATALGTISAICLVIEIVIIVWAAAVGTTSHFNVATALNEALWEVMGVSIAIVWLINLLIAVALFFDAGPDAARNLAIRAGVVIGLAGMAVAFFMTSPNQDQLADFQGIAGAHAVGVTDGGPGIPFFGWSTEGGDLRVPHFIGMHALQIIPLALLALELASGRVTLLRSVRVRFLLVLIGGLSYAALLVVLTLQALAGQSVVAPSGGYLIAEATIAIVWVLASAAVLSLGALLASRRTMPVVTPGGRSGDTRPPR